MTKIVSGGRRRAVRDVRELNFDVRLGIVEDSSYRFGGWMPRASRASRV